MKTNYSPVLLCVRIMNAQNKQLRKRWRASNTCVMCGLPFASVGRIGMHSDIMQKFQDIFKDRYPSSPGLFDIPNDCHLFHRKDWDVFPRGVDYASRPIVLSTEEQARAQRLLNQRCLKMDSILRQLRDKRVADDAYRTAHINAEDRKFVHPSERVVTERLHTLQTITFAGCQRCNDLMTMQQPTSRMSIACGILKPSFHTTRTMVRDARRLLREKNIMLETDSDLEGEDDSHLYDGNRDENDGNEEQPEGDEEEGGGDDEPPPPPPQEGGGAPPPPPPPPAPAAAAAADAEEQRALDALRNLATQKIKNAKFSEKLAFQELIRRSVNRAVILFQTFTRQELYTLFHAFAYVLAANLTCERVEVDDIKVHDKFRIDGLQKIYTSFFFYVVNTVRFPVMFMQIPFEVWHVSFFEARTLNTCVSFKTSVYSNERFVPEYNKNEELSWSSLNDELMPKTRIGLLRMMRTPRQARLDILTTTIVQNRRLWRWQLPSIWQIAWMALGNHAIKKRVSMADAMMWEHRRYFPTPSYTRFVFENLFTISELNIDKWVEEFGRRMMYRRMLMTTQFSMDVVCLDFLQRTLVLVQPLGSDAEKYSVRKRNYVKFVGDMFIEMHKKASLALLDAGDYYTLQLSDNPDKQPIEELRKDFKNESKRHLLYAVGPMSDDDVDDIEGAVEVAAVQQGVAAMGLAAEVEPGYNAQVEAQRRVAARQQARQEYAQSRRVIERDEAAAAPRRQSSRIAQQGIKNIFDRLAARRGGDWVF